MAPLIKYILLLVCFLQCNFSYTQNEEIDSFRQSLSKAKTDLERTSIMGKLISRLINTDLAEAKTYAEDALELSLKIGDKENEAIALNNMGLVLYEGKDRKSSILYYEKGEKLASELRDGELQSRILMNIAKYHRYEAKDSTKTVDTFLKSAEVSKTVDFHWGTGRSYAKIASFYTKSNQIDLCEKYLKLASTYYLKTEGGAKTVAHYYNEVGDKIWHTNPRKSIDFYLEGRKYANTPNLMTSLAKVYSFIGEDQKALAFLEEAIPYFREDIYGQRMLGMAVAQLAEVHIKLDNFDSAEKACDEGIELLANLGRSNQRANPSYFRIKGIIAQKEGDNESALNYYTKALDEAIRIKYSLERDKARLAIGNLLKVKEPTRAREFCETTYRSAKRNNFTTLEADACNCLFNVYKNENSYESALFYHEQQISLNESLAALKVKHALEVNSKIAEKDKQIAEQQHQKDIQNIYIKSLLFTSLLGILLIGFLTVSYRRIQKQNEEINQKTSELKQLNESLGQSNKELERFAHVASHDLKSPLRNIISFTELLRRNLNGDKKPIVNESLRFIEDNGKRMNQLIDDVLKYSTHTNREINKNELIDLQELVIGIFQLSPTSPNGKQYTYEVKNLPVVKWNSSQLFLLFKNIIENGLKYNESETPNISIHGKKSETMYSIFIEDNGIGIKPEYYDKIFVMFQRLHTQDIYEGSGLGLATSKKIVDEMGGNISVKSENNKGTIFKIDIPNRIIHSSNKKQSIKPVLEKNIVKISNIVLT